MRHLFVIIVVLAAQSAAQDLTKALWPHIPSAVRRSLPESSYVAERLRTYADIHPDVVFWYVHTLELQQQHNAAVARQAELATEQAANAKLLQRRTWAARVIDSLSASGVPKPIVDRARSYFEDLPQPKVSATPPPFETMQDANRSNFFAVLFLTQDSSIVYEPSTDYKAIRVEAEDRLSAGLDSSVEVAHRDPDRSRSHDDDMNTIVTHWYCFEESNDLRQVASYMLAFLRDSYSTEGLRVWEVDGWRVENNTIKFIHTIFDIPRAKIPLPLNFVRGQFGLAASYSYYRRPWDSFASYVRVRASILSSSLNETYHPSLNRSLSYFSSYLNTTEHMSELRIKRVTSMAFEASIPFLFFKWNTHIAVGGLYISNVTSYDFRYSFDYSFDDDAGPPVSGTATEDLTNLTMRSSKLLPVVLVNYSWNDGLTVSARLSPGLVGIEIGHKF